MCNVDAGGLWVFNAIEMITDKKRAEIECLNLFLSLNRGSPCALDTCATSRVFSLQGFEFIKIKVVVEGTMKAGLIR
jgi:hypothetical protein